MRTVAKILRARASEHSCNFCEQFEQRPNFASTFKLNETILHPSRWIVDPGNLLLLLLVSNILRSTSFFVCFSKLTVYQIFCHTKSTPHPLFKEHIFSLAWVASPQKESGLGWVCTKWLPPQLYQVTTIRNHIDNWNIAKTGHYWTAQGNLVTVHSV